MKKRDLRWLKELAYFSSVGLSVALSIFIGLGLGLFVDSKTGWSPVGMFVGLALGIVAGFRNIGLAIKKSRKL